MSRLHYRWLVTALLACALGAGCASKPQGHQAAMTEAEVEQQMLEAEGQLANNHLDKAGAILERVVGAVPAHPHAWYRLGIVYLRSNKPELAQHAFSQSLSANPDLKKAYANLALAHLMQFRSVARLAMASDQVPEANRAALKALLEDVELGLAPLSDRLPSPAVGLQVPAPQPAQTPDTASMAPSSETGKSTAREK